MLSIIPFKIKRSPIKMLALIPFEKAPEDLYRGFELQYIEGEECGTGYRVLAYRNDNYVDVYDDNSLVFNAAEEFNVVENGLNKHVQTKIEDAVFENRSGRQVLGFKFTDIENRMVEFYYEEKTMKKSTPMNLLAPIGLGSKCPKFLPLFFLYDFDFMRRTSEARCVVDGRNMTLDKFPFPMNGQFRSYVRYSNCCELLEFAGTDHKQIEEIHLDGSMKCVCDNAEYQFSADNVLDKITLLSGTGELVVKFEPAFDMNKNCEGTFSICPSAKMGYISGKYTICKENTVLKIRMIPSDGWISVPTSLISKMVLNKNSVFCTWSKNYEYNSCVDLCTDVAQAEWVNHNIDSKG